MEPFTLRKPNPHSDGVAEALDASVTARLRAAAARLRGYVLVEGMAWVVSFLLASASLQFLIDYGTRGLRWSMRAAMLGLIVAGVLWLLWRRVVAPLRLRFSAAQIANLIERRYPELSSLLISAVRFSSGEVGPSEANSPALVASVIRRAGSHAGAVDFNAVLDSRRARRSGMAIVTALLLVVGAVAALPEQVIALWFARNILLQDVEWPRRTHLIVEAENGELIGARGDDLVVQARAEGVQPREVEFIFETASGQRGREAMVTVGSRGSYRYRYTFKAAQEDFTFYLEGGDDQTETFRARLLERPRVARTEMHITPPAYTRLEAYSLGNAERAAQILPGSSVTIRIETNKPVTQTTLMAGRDVVADAAPSVAPSSAEPVPQAAEHFSVSVSPLESHTYHFALVDEVGLENRRPVRLSLRVIVDDPPRARLKLPGVGDMITPEAVLPIEVECADTYGLAAAELVYEIAREGTEEEGLIPLPTFKPYLTMFMTTLNWPVSTEGLQVTQTLTLQVSAADFDNISGPNEAESPPVLLRVVTRDELLAELARREQEFRADFERLIDAQEQLRGGLLTVLGRFQQESAEQVLPADLAPLERRQRNIAGSVNVIRQQFEQILAELRVNQLDTLDERTRLSELIVNPLARLAKRDLVAAADAVRQWSREGSADRAVRVDPLQVQILSQMRSVLANMIQWEGYQEVVSMFRDILRLQQELKAETQETIEDQAGDVFDDEN